jgi:hypothetical protein
MKAFFFEKKKQKTFIRCRGPSTRAREQATVFWFPQGGRRLFFKKEHSFFKDYHDTASGLDHRRWP